jgi:hypothetical protein
MSTLPSAPDALALFAQCLKKVPDPRSKQGTSHPFSTLLAVVLLGLLAKVSTPAEIARWTEQRFAKLSKFLRFGKIKGELKSPCDNTVTRVLKKLSLADLQNAFAEFVNAILKDTTLVAAVDGKAAKQMKDENGDPILMCTKFRPYFYLIFPNKTTLVAMKFPKKLTLLRVQNNKVIRLIF